MKTNATATRIAQQLLLDALRHPLELPMLSNTQWDLLIRVARRARLLGRLEFTLSQASLIGHIPPRAADHLIAARNIIEHRKTLTTWEVNRVLWALDGIEGPLILLKGVAYVMANLPPANGRIFADVDLLVPEHNLAKIEARLVERGWMKIPIHPYDDRYYRVWTHEIPPLRHRERGTEIDIHHRLLPRTSRLTSDPAPLFAASRPLANPRLHVLAPADMVLHALVHLFLEGDPDEGLRFRDLVDVHDLLCYYGKEPQFWTALASRGCELGFERPLYYGLYHASRLLGTPIPQVLIGDLEKTTPRVTRATMNGLIRAALLPEHPDHPTRLASWSRWMLYVRAHWLRMRPMLLTKHLAHKAWLRFRGATKHIDLAQLDLKQQ